MLENSCPLNHIPIKNEKEKLKVKENDLTTRQRKPYMGRWDPTWWRKLPKHSNKYMTFSNRTGHKSWELNSRRVTKHQAVCLERVLPKFSEKIDYTQLSNALQAARTRRIHTSTATFKISHNIIAVQVLLEVDAEQN